MNQESIPTRYFADIKIKSDFLKEHRRKYKTNQALLILTIVLYVVAFALAIRGVFDIIVFYKAYDYYVLSGNTVIASLYYYRWEIFAILAILIGMKTRLAYLNKAGKPYSGYSKERITIYNDGIVISRRINENIKSNPLNRSEYCILKDEISAVRYSKSRHVITIIGAGELKYYEDFYEKEYREGSVQKLYPNTPYEILMCFENEYDIVCQIMDLAPRRFFDD